MSNLSFEWDERKSVANATKHGVSFEEAKSVFVDERAKLINDPDHSDDEGRFCSPRFEWGIAIASGLPLLSR
jgi:hypothetical protein